MVDKFFVFEATRFQRHRDNVDTVELLLFHCLTLASDEVPASLLDESVRFNDLLVTLVTVRSQSQYIGPAIIAYDVMYDESGTLSCMRSGVRKGKHTAEQLAYAS